MKLKSKKIILILLAVIALGGIMQIGSALAQSGWFTSSSKPSYEEWLNTLDVHDKFKVELDQLKASHAQGDLMTAYTFLYYQYGIFDQLEPIVKQKEDGASWKSVFSEYLEQHHAFVPRTYDTNELENLTSSASITSDDIMVADRLSFVSGQPMKGLLAAKLESGTSWKDAAADLNIVNGASSLPRVEVTAEEISQYATGKFPQEKVIQAFVLSQKVGLEPKDVVSKLKDGRSETEIMATAWSGLFSSK